MSEERDKNLKDKTKEESKLQATNKRPTTIEEKLRKIEWLLTKSIKPTSRKKIYTPSYGDLTELNRPRVILDSVGADLLVEIASDYLDLLETSGAIYEKNGDYALGIFSSGWCQFLDQASRNFCGTDDNAEALDSGKWRCHESCWAEASKISIETGQPVDIECDGGIHLYAAPIWAGKEIIGSINFGHGDPPKDLKKLQEIAEKYEVSIDGLLEQAEAYESRPPFIIDIAKNRLLTSAKLIGTIVEQKRAEKQLIASGQQLKAANQQLRASDQQLLQEIERRRRLQKVILNVSEREQQRIGRELHDSLGQQLTGIAFMTETFERKLAKKKLPDEAASAAEIVELVKQAREGVRALTHGLQPIDLAKGSLMSSLRELATSTEGVFGIHCTFECDKPFVIDDEVVVHLYRIAQEAVTNAIRHGKTKNIQIKLTRDRGEASLTVKSDGLDFPKEFEARGTGAGLQIMDQRADIIGGSLSIHKAAKGGTILTCTFSLKKA